MIFEDFTLKSLSVLTYDEKIMILEWRNHDNIRKWMYNSKPIPKETHLKFIENLELDKNNRYFLVQKNNENLGVIYFHNIDFTSKNTYFGLYVNPYINVSGIGSLLEELCQEYAFDVLQVNTLSLEVFSNNIKAIKLYKKYNFNEIGKKIVNDKEVICMELRNTDR